MATQPQNPKDAEGARPTVAPTFQYIDRPDVLETFADSIEGTFFDGQTLRIEFCVNRLDPLKPNTPPTGRRYPACRLVLTPAAAVELMNRMQQISRHGQNGGAQAVGGPTRNAWSAGHKLVVRF
jgi:hypothetical protein